MKNIIMLLLVSVLVSWNIDRKFPNFSYISVQGTTITNDYFADSSTIVVLFHIGCPAAMVLIKDMQILHDKKLLYSKVLLLAENTNNQLVSFNSDEENVWSGIRKKFDIQKITFDLIGECTTENVKTIGNDIIISSQCRALGKKLRVNYCPEIIKVDLNGKIEGKWKKGYTMQSNPSSLEIILKDL